MKRFLRFLLVLSIPPVLMLGLAGCDKEENPLYHPGAGSNAPVVPALDTPVNGAVDQDIPTSLAWNLASGATSYAVQVSRNQGFTDIFYSAAGLTATRHDVPDLGCGTKYWWRVAAKNDAGTSGWSTPRAFTTFELATPALSSPLNRESDRQLALTLSWSPIDRAGRYALQVSVDSTFGNPARIVVDDSGLTATSYELSGLCRTSTYYWRVRGAVGSFCSAWSSRWSFATIGACDQAAVTVGGEAYETVSIRNQCWLKKNLDLGSMVGSGVASADDASIQKYCYDNDPAMCAEHGGLYSWDEAMQYSTRTGAGGICPDGWRIPTSADIATLSQAVCDTALSRYFVTPVDGGTNESGFSAHLAGYYDYGYFGEEGAVAKFWISELDNQQRARYWVLGKTGYALVWVRADRNAGYSVRCVRE